MMKPVFIIGFSRTGSTLLQHILNNHSPVGIVPEMHIYWPRKLHVDFATTVQSQIGNLADDAKVDELIELMYSKKLIGTFWQVIDKANIDVDDLKKHILASDRSVGGIVDALLNSLGKTYKKKIMGAKFPVHFTCADRLLEWYPECRIIHTVRDPRAIFTSQYYKRKKKNRGVLKNIAIGVLQFIHVTGSFRRVGKMHARMRSRENYYVHKYEDMVSDPETSLKKLCVFLEIPFNEEMLHPNIFYNTSFEQKRLASGIRQSSRDAWKKRLPRPLANLIRLITRRSMKLFDYA